MYIIDKFNTKVTFLNSYLFVAFGLVVRVPLEVATLNPFWGSTSSRRRFLDRK
jgi:hypothetical protein